MQRIFGLILLMAAASGLAEEGGFSHSISRGDFESVGLDQLSPAQLKRLDELIAAYKSPDVAAARRQAEEAITARKAAEAEAKAAKAEAADVKKGNQGFLAKAKVLLVPGTKIEYAVIKSTVAGKFEGWEGHAVIPLVNGQRWQVINSGDRYFIPPKDNVEVQVSSSAFGGYMMDFPGLNVQVRVRLLPDN